MRIRDGQLSLRAPPGVQGPLITMPTALRVQSELLQLSIALYNASGKVHWWSSEHPVRLLDNRPALAAAVERVKPGYGKPPGPARGRQWAAKGFLNTRSDNHASELNGKTESMLLALIDLMNHHQGGAGLSIVAGAMVINPGQLDCNCESYCFYGCGRGALELALHSGFPDTLTPYAHHSVRPQRPIDFNLGAIGSLRIRAQLREQPNHPLDAPCVELRNSGIVLSHVGCDRSQRQRLQTVLNLAFRAGFQRRGHDWRLAEALSQVAMTAINEDNQERLPQLILAIEALQPSHPQASIPAEAAHHQAAVMADVLGSNSTVRSNTASAAR